MANQGQILNSWKEIAAYLDRSVRTCQNLEMTMGLPVHRLERSSKARVFAYRDEIDAWLETNSGRAATIKKKSFFRKRPVLKVFLLFVAIYILALGTGVINDYVYRQKLGKIAAEFDTYYEGYFPIKKEWLGDDPSVKDTNSFREYLSLLSRNLDSSRRWQSVKQISRDLKYVSVEDLESFRDQNPELFLKLGDLWDAVRCSSLDAREIYSRNLQGPMFPYFPAVYELLGGALIDVRVDVLNGRLIQAVEKLRLLLFFVHDLECMADGYIGIYLASYAIRLVYPDLIVLALSVETPSMNILDPLIEFSNRILADCDVERSCHRNYLYFGKLLSAFGWYDPWTRMGSISNFLFGRMRVWRHGFSLYRTAFSEVSFYERVFQGLRYIKGDREKSIYLRDYTSQFASLKAREAKHGLGPVVPDISMMCFKLNISRVMTKAFKLICVLKRYGFDSKEFVQYQKTADFINELAGTPFKIRQDQGAPSITLDEDYRLSLKKIDYAKEHRQMLYSFKHYEIIDPKGLEPIFYSFELR